MDRWALVTIQVPGDLFCALKSTRISSSVTVAAWPRCYLDFLPLANVKRLRRSRRLVRHSCEVTDFAVADGSYSTPQLGHAIHSPEKLFQASVFHVSGDSCSHNGVSAWSNLRRFEAGMAVRLIFHSWSLPNVASTLSADHFPPLPTSLTGCQRPLDLLA